MDFRLSAQDEDLRRRARAFADEHLVPYEAECEASDGLSEASLAAIREAVFEQRFNAVNHAIADGGQGFGLFQQVLVEEQWGRATGALWDVPWRPAIPLRYGSDDQKERYLRPACRGERRDAYAITEANAGSDPTMVTTTAVRGGDGWILNGEKWHVTSGDVADFFLVHANVDGDSDKATVFLVDKGLPGVRVVRTPKYMHRFVFEHPIFSFEDVHVTEDCVLGDVGAGYDLTKEWFVEERLMIAARTVGASIRALEESHLFASDRVQFGRSINSFQGISHMLAEMATEIAAAKSLLYRCALQAEETEPHSKEVHALVAATKLFCSETAGRVLDRAVQIHGGRGYMREYAVERLWREVRVDRLWEGTSEIQKEIISNELAKRGPAVFTEWP
jgi:acyl-CoA dehydrogenase